jgi:hypothetical protein
VICSLLFFRFRLFSGLLGLAGLVIAADKRHLLDRSGVLGGGLELVFGGLGTGEGFVEEVGWEGVNGVHFGD